MYAVTAAGLFLWIGLAAVSTVGVACCLIYEIFGGRKK